ncbi:hypothetical protein L2X99_16595 [Microbacterium sp. KUDC0406]|uniref:sugar-binding transcriptional regulator n=1 Tax=Microbacterium sp. KUDC0406 TaxID=2909588 RepID=UPI001F35866B|nr:sugar-binding domain-containing protein [Microbacterium sp. KUDC0406]UJP09961.1 hypothetical protein L2X99_16595 [Microbacterium sp. KUDC0406]
MAERGRPRNVAGLEAAVVARRFYIMGKQKSEIADELGITRFKVARLLDDAREAGMVHISIDMPSEIDVELGELVAARWGIRRCLPVTTLGADEDATAIVAQAAAHHLDDILDQDDVVGLSWGRTLTETVSAMSMRTGADAVQLVGGIRVGQGTVGGAELVRRFASITGGAAHALNAPFLVGSAQMAATLRAEASLQDTVSRFGSLSLAVVGVGAWQPPRTAIIDEITAAERDALLASGACADICGVILDTDGRPLDSSLSARVVGASIEELRAIPQTIAVAAGVAKTAAVQAALRSGLVSTLVVDAVTARQLLAV